MRDTANEYEMAAEWCAKRGIKGKHGDPLPDLLGSDVCDEIAADPEAFQERVRAYAYERAMLGVEARARKRAHRRRHKCENVCEVTCLGCGLVWCDRCDPAHGPLCPQCHGLGYTTAYIRRDRHMIER